MGAAMFDENLHCVCFVKRTILNLTKIPGLSASQWPAAPQAAQEESMENNRQRSVSKLLTHNMTLVTQRSWLHILLQVL